MQETISTKAMGQGVSMVGRNSKKSQGKGGWITQNLLYYFTDSL